MKTKQIKEKKTYRKQGTDMLEKTNTHKNENKTKIERDKLLPHHRASPYRMLCLINSFYLVLTMTHLECSVQFWSPLYKRDKDRLQRVQRRATKILVTTLYLFSKTHLYNAIVIRFIYLSIMVFLIKNLHFSCKYDNESFIWGAF